MNRRCHSPPIRCPLCRAALTQRSGKAAGRGEMEIRCGMPAARTALGRGQHPCRRRPLWLARVRNWVWLGWYALILFLVVRASPGFAQVERVARAAELRNELSPPEREVARARLTSTEPDAPLASWWDAAVHKPLWNNTIGYDTRLDDLVGRTLQCSLEVKAASQQVLISQTMVEESCSIFDWATFLETKWKDLDEPVGNELITGGPPRLLNDQSVTKGGVRRRTELGGVLEFSQQLGIEQSNSLFFVPPNQGQSRLALTYRQPLLRGAGRKYNRALIVLASIDTQAARDQFLSDLETHLFDVSRAYWTMYQERALLLQKRRSVEQVAELLQILERRQNLDVVTSQLVRAQAAYEQRRAAILPRTRRCATARPGCDCSSTTPRYRTARISNLCRASRPLRSRPRSTSPQPWRPPFTTART